MSQSAQRTNNRNKTLIDLSRNERKPLVLGKFGMEMKQHICEVNKEKSGRLLQAKMKNTSVSVLAAGCKMWSSIG